MCAASCAGAATAVAASCTGTATEIAASCTGTATDGSLTCDLDASTDGSGACPAGCTDTAASTPTCDLDASTDGSAACPAGCTAGNDGGAGACCQELMCTGNPDSSDD